MNNQPVQIEKENKEFELLTKVSGSELLTTFDFKGDAVNHTRLLCFSNMNGQVAKHYYALNSNNKKIVGKIVDRLINGIEHQGFNLQVYLHWLTAPSEFVHVDQALISKHITALNDPYVISQSSDSVTRSSDVTRRIHALKKSKKLEDGSALLRVLSDNLLFSEELIRTGIGEIEVIKPEILKEYENHPEFYQVGRKQLSINGNKYKFEDLLVIPIREKYEKFAKHLGKSWDDIVEKKYCAISFTYGYKFLEKGSKQEDKQLVDNLIEELYAQQQEYNVIAQKMETTAKNLENLYLHIIKNGIIIRKGDVKDLAELFEFINQP